MYLSTLSQFCLILSLSLSIPAHVSFILFQLSFNSLPIHFQFSFILFPFSLSSCSCSLILPQFFLILSQCSFSSLLFSRIPLSSSLSSLSILISSLSIILNSLSGLLHSLLFSLDSLPFSLSLSLSLYALYSLSVLSHSLKLLSILSRFCPTSRSVPLNSRSFSPKSLSNIKYHPISQDIHISKYIAIAKYIPIPNYIPIS
jgi:hypothetical protein